MKIRSITSFYHPKTEHASQDLKTLAEFSQTARKRFVESGFEVQSTRLATVPFPHYMDLSSADRAVSAAVTLQNHVISAGFSYLSLGPALPEFPESYALIPPMLQATRNVFFGGVIATPANGVILPAVKASGAVIARASALTVDGFTNLCFAALANVRPYTPFFPASYAEGEQPAFALAMEAADVALQVFRQAKSLQAARSRLLQTLEEQGRVLADISASLSKTFGVPFKGIDFSLAPYPSAWSSIGSALERLGPPHIGQCGSLAAAAFLADALDDGKWPRAGFNGLMLPVLEDATLSERSAHGQLTVKDLLLYSAVCGTGLDTVPLPGDTSPEQLSALLLDVAALSTRLAKPLTARLMPIPGKRAGESTEFSFNYFANGGVMELYAAPLRGLMAGDESFQLRVRALG